MKTIFFTLFISCALALCGHAQDVIIKRNGEQLKGNVSEINVDDIVYKPVGNQTGILVKVLKKELHKIVFSNGSEEVFNSLLKNSSQTTTPYPPASSILEVPKAPSTAVSQTSSMNEPKSIFQDEPPAPNSPKKFFSSIGLLYRKDFFENAADEIGIQGMVGYRFSKSVGLALMLEPSYAISDNTFIDIVAYPAIIANITNSVKLYGGYGFNGYYYDTDFDSGFIKNSGYQAGIIIDIGGMGNIKLGYLNNTEKNSKGGLSVALSTPLNW
jgi:hypothetical protein